MHNFCIVFSNHSALLFAWKGTPAENKKYLGNREIMGTVQADDETQALAAWHAKPQ
jgi:hypothetical protein